MAGYTIEALVLKHQPLGENDRLVTALSRHRGKVRAVARGAGKPSGKLGALIQPFNRCRLDLYRGRSLDGITGGEVLESLRGIRESLDEVCHATCMAEMTIYITQEGDSDEPLFLLLLTCLHALMKKVDPYLVSSFFFVRAIKLAGFSPVLDRCHICGGPIEGEGAWDYSGGMVCADCVGSAGSRSRLREETRQFLLGLESVHPRLLADMQLPREVTAEALEVMLDWSEYHIDRKLNSRRFLDILG